MLVTDELLQLLFLNYMMKIFGNTLVIRVRGIPPPCAPAEPFCYKEKTPPPLPDIIIFCVYINFISQLN